jgi:hypothetical protein
MQASAAAQCSPTLFIPFAKNFRETRQRSAVVNEHGISLVDSDGDVTKLGI